MPGGDLIGESDVNDAGSSHSNTDTKAGKQAATSFLTAAGGVSFKNGKMSREG